MEAQFSMRADGRTDRYNEAIFENVPKNEKNNLAS
jgi:hypothetical protein